MLISTIWRNVQEDVFIRLYMFHYSMFGLMFKKIVCKYWSIFCDIFRIFSANNETLIFFQQITNIGKVYIFNSKSIKTVLAQCVHSIGNSLKIKWIFVQKLFHWLSISCEYIQKVPIPYIRVTFHASEFNIGLILSHDIAYISLILNMLKWNIIWILQKATYKSLADEEWIS